MLSTIIKDATQEAHQRLEKKLVLKLKSIRSHADYADLLKYFYAYFNALEQAIKPHITTRILPDHAERRHAGFLRQDIEELGSSIAVLPDVQAPQIGNTMEALGALYVMEGSIMGGSIIVQMLAKHGIGKGISFFSGYGDDTVRMWSRFIDVLNSQSVDKRDEAQAISAANATFANFSGALGETEGDR